MKVIISHDVDHITVKEHYNDALIPKLIIRSFIEFSLGKININEILLRASNLFKNKWQNINEIINYNKQLAIPSTFFIGVNNGLGLKYNNQLAALWIQKIIEQGFDAGVHGIAFDNLKLISEEFKTFKQISKQDNFGIRMHYLRNNNQTIDFLSKAGYCFDSSVYKLENPYKINNMWEFPLHIMDGYEIEAGKSWQSLSLNKIKENTLRKIDSAIKNNINYHTVLFHDRYFDKSFATWMNWYIWITEWFIQNNFEFISYKDTILELNNNAKVN